MAQIKLSTIKHYSKIRVNSEFVVAGIDSSELLYCLYRNSKRPMPRSFEIAGAESKATMELTECLKGDEGDVEFWRYTSTNTVVTRDGPRKVALTVYND